MLIQDVMTRDPKCCVDDQTGAEAAQIFWDNDCGSVPIVNTEGKLAGIVTDRDLCLATHFRNCTPHDVHLSEFTGKAPWSCHADQPIEDALSLMEREKVHRIPIVDGGQRVIGLVSLNDVTRASEQTGTPDAQSVAQAVAHICEPAAASQR